MSFRIGDKVWVKNTRTIYHGRTGRIVDNPTPQVRTVELAVGGKRVPFSVIELEKK